MTRFANESNFLLKRTVDPGFYRFVKKKEKMKEEWFWAQVRELGYLILLDILNPENATPTKAARKPKEISNGAKNFSDKWVTERHLNQRKARPREHSHEASDHIARKASWSGWKQHYECAPWMAGP